jgi:hypothetical protein
MILCGKRFTLVRRVAHIHHLRLWMRRLWLLQEKGKGKSKKKGSESGVGGKKKNIDFFKVKCFQCHKFGHFASMCLDKKKSKQ